MRTHQPYKEYRVQQNQLARQPEEMLLEALDALKNGNVEPWVEMFTDDGVIEFPYAPPGYPARLDGKAVIAAYMRTYPDHIAIRQVSLTAAYHDQDATVVEFACESTALGTGNQFRMEYVGVIRLSQGKVRSYRDYWNPLVALQAMGGADALLELGDLEKAESASSPLG